MQDFEPESSYLVVVTFDAICEEVLVVDVVLDEKSIHSYAVNDDLLIVIIDWLVLSDSVVPLLVLLVQVAVVD